MLNRPYNGHIPDYSSRPAPYANGSSAPVSPSVHAQRQLRQEQDAAFHESLKV